MNNSERTRLVLAIKTLSAALRLVKAEAEIGLSRAQVQLIDSALMIADEELEDADAYAS